MRSKLFMIICAVLLAASLALMAGCGDDENEATLTTETTAGTQTTAGDTTETSVGTGTSAPGAQEGIDVFAENCASCHGANGSGGTAPALTTTQFTRAEIKRKVTDGGEAMPSFRDQLSEEQIGSVSDYVYDELRQP